MDLLMTPVKFMTRICKRAIKPGDLTIDFKQSNYQVQVISGILRTPMHAKSVGTWCSGYHCFLQRLQEMHKIKGLW